MFGKQFYPTPPELAKKMVQPYFDGLNRDYTVLDPSAGSGNLLSAVMDVIWEGMEIANQKTQARLDELYETNTKEWQRVMSYSHWYNKDMDLPKYLHNLHAIEIDPDLQHIIRGKKYKVIGSDFLTFDTPYNFNLIVMNPPFESGAKHLLKAWDILTEGDIVCLLNAETINNPYTQERETVKAIIEKYGEVERVGQPFKDAYRPTDVEVVLVRLKKVKQEKLGLFDDPKFTKTDLGSDLNLDDIRNDELAKRDVIGNLVQQYNEAAEYYIEYRRACRKMYQMRSRFDFEGGRKDIQDPSSYRTSTSKSNESGDQKDYNEYLQELTKAAWKTVFRLTGFEKRMTESVRKEFEKNREGMLVMAFTEENIYNVLETLIGAADQIAKQCVLDVYDELTKYHPENREIVEGWKSNNAYRVKRKVVLPRGVTFGWSGRFEVDYRLRDGIIGDIDKAMSFLAGVHIDSVKTIFDSVNDRGKEIQAAKGMLDTKCESEFFEIRFYKKGTIHLKFKDTKLWDRLNKFVAKERGWLQDYEKPKKADVVLFSDHLENVM